MLPALVDQGFAGWGVKTPMGLPLCTCAVVNRPAAVREVRAWSSEPADTVKPSAVRVRDCLSSSHSSLMAEKATR